MIAKTLTFISVLNLLSSTAYATEALDTSTGFSCMPMVTEGYLIDNLCWEMEGHIAIDGTDLGNNPENHTKHCMLLAQCVSSGYGIIKLNSNGTYDYWADLTDVNATAYKFIINSNKTDNFLVNVSATVCMDNKQLTGGNLFTMSDEFQSVSATVGVSGGGVSDPITEAASPSEGYRLGSGSLLSCAVVMVSVVSALVM